MMRFVMPMLGVVAPQEEGGRFDITEMIMHHLADSPKWESPWGKSYGWQSPPLHIGPITIDYSITKHVLFMMISAVLVMILLVTAGRAAKREHARGAERGRSSGWPDSPQVSPPRTSFSWSRGSCRL